MYSTKNYILGKFLGSAKDDFNRTRIYQTIISKKDGMEKTVRMSDCEPELRHYINNKGGGATIFERPENIIGYKNGNTEVISMGDRDSSGHERWECRCNRCGQSFFVRPYILLSGTQTDCGCSHEYKGEVSIRNILNANNKTFKAQYHWPQLTNKRCSFDFAVYNLTAEHELTFIEYDGRQHYEYISYIHRDIKNFEGQVRRDQLKNNTCVANHTRLIRIPYTIKANKITYDMLINPEEYADLGITIYE